jgi:cytochrome c-type biogenesis protein CcmH/NrfG
VLSIDPKDPRARYYLAEAQAEIGAWDKAYDQWMALLRDGGDQADYAEIVQARIADAAKRLGRDVPKIVSAPPNPSPPAASPPAVSSGGPTAQDIAQAAQMGAGDRQAMIETMVARLAEKMENSPNDPAGWRKLARAYLVLGRIDPALSAYEKAQALDPKSAEGQSGLVTALRQGPGVKDPRYLPALRQLLALDPDNADALMDLGAFELGTGNVPAARDLWARLLAGFPRFLAGRLSVALAVRRPRRSSPTPLWTNRKPRSATWPGSRRKGFSPKKKPTVVVEEDEEDGETLGSEDTDDEDAEEEAEDAEEAEEEVKAEPVIPTQTGGAGKRPFQIRRK